MLSLTPTPEGVGFRSLRVTREYARVLVPEHREQPRVCPACEDRIRDGAEVREARATRR